MPNNIRISLKIDTLENWNSSSLILQNGEVAFIQMPNGTTKIKIGDGVNLVKQLPFINEIEFFTKELSTQQLNIGLQNKTSTYSSVIGQHLSANSTNSTAFGFNAETLSADQFSFVWNGKNLYGYDNRYASHGAGTFSLNPENGISGVYIGEDTLASMLNTIYVNGEKVDELQVINISQDEYHSLVKDNNLLSNAIYVVSSDMMNMYNRRIINLADGISANDAATYGQLSALKQYHDTSITDIQLIKPEFSNAKIHVRLSAYSDSELSENIIAVDSANQQQYFLGFYNTAETQSWKTCPADGFGTEYDNCPILIKLVDILKDNDLANKYNKLYIIYEWHYSIDNQDYISDRYSIVVPSYTEVGANASDYVTKKQHIELESEIFKDTYAVEKQENNMYVCYSNKFNVISEMLTGTTQIILDSFNKNRQYDIQFKTGDSKVILEFNYEDKINGIVFDDSWNINSNYVFEPNRSYMIKVFQDFISVTEDKYDGTVSGNLSYKLVNAEPINSNPLTYNIEDRTITTIVVSDSQIPVTVNFPQKIDGYARDFIIRIEVTTTEVPEFNFAGLGDSWSVDAEDAEWMFMKPGTNVISFTEMK